MSKPTPLSRTNQTTPDSPRRAPISMRGAARSEEYLIAFDTRFCSTWRSSTASPSQAGNSPISASKADALTPRKSAITRSASSRMSMRLRCISRRERRENSSRPSISRPMCRALAVMRSMRARLIWLSVLPSSMPTRLAKPSMARSGVFRSCDTE